MGENGRADRLQRLDETRVEALLRGVGRRGIVCSESWLEVCIKALDAGLVRNFQPDRMPQQLRPNRRNPGAADLVAELARAGVYPPELGPRRPPKRLRAAGQLERALREAGLWPATEIGGQGWRRCGRCGRIVPAVAHGRDRCLDCYYADTARDDDGGGGAGGSHSVSGVSIGRLRDIRGRIYEKRLPPESEEALRVEIERAG